MSNSSGSNETIYKYYNDYNRNYTAYEKPIDLNQFKSICYQNKGEQLFYYRYSGKGTYNDINNLVPDTNTAINKYFDGVIIQIKCDNDNDYLKRQLENVNVYKGIITFTVPKNVDTFLTNNGKAQQQQNVQIKLPQVFNLTGANFCSDNGCLYKYISIKDMIERQGKSVDNKPTGNEPSSNELTSNEPTSNEPTSKGGKIYIKRKNTKIYKNKLKVKQRTTFKHNKKLRLNRASKKTVNQRKTK